MKKKKKNLQKLGHSNPELSYNDEVREDCEWNLLRFLLLSDGSHNVLLLSVNSDMCV